MQYAKWGAIPRRTGGVLLLSCGLAAVGVFGCGGSPSSDESPAPAAELSPPSPSETASDPTSASPNASPQQISARTDADGRKWVGDIPYDVFFDDPLAIVANTQEVPGASAPVSPLPQPMPQNAESASPEPSAAAASSAAGADWGKVISAAILDNEVKFLRNELTQKLQSVGKYNASTFEIPVHGATLSVMAGIATAHPGDISWKDKAKYVRDLGLKIAEAAEGPGRKNYDATLAPFEQVVALLNGNEPAGLEDAEDSVPFADVAERIDIMKRMEQAFKWLKTNVNSEQALKDEQEKVLHEAAVLAALTQAIAAKDYYKNDPETYDGFAEMMVNASLKAGEAAQNGRFDEFSQSLDQIQKSCNECHAKERF